MKNLILSFVGVAVTVANASPVVEIVKTVQDPVSRVVTVEYSLSVEPAVITLGVETNRGDGVYVSIGEKHIWGASGDVNRLVQTGTRSLRWRPDKSWPNHLITDKSLRVGVVAWATNAPPDYMVVDLQNPGTVRYYSSAESLPGGSVTCEVYKTNHLLLRKIPAAGVEWNMGSNTKEPGRAANETIHRVKLSNDYYIGVYEVTRRQYYLITGNTPSTSAVYAGDNPDQCPVDSLKWVDLRSSGSIWPANGHAVGSGSALALLRGLANGIPFDLPTEAQWEYACRAGSGYAYNVGGDEQSDMEQAGWCKENAGQDANGKYCVHAVGGKRQNDWGLFDMHGNVSEFCLDYIDGDYSVTDEVTVDPKGLESATYRVRRGGDRGRPYSFCRSAQRLDAGPNGCEDYYGFRVACEAVAK